MAQHLIFVILVIAGYIIGLGAVTVIDIHGFLGRKSPYWTRATISAHKVTKPLIWVGTLLVSVGTLGYYLNAGLSSVAYIHWSILTILILNGIFLSFWLSPKLLEKEKQGKETELLPQSWQVAITASFIVSFLGWWGSLLIFLNYLLIS